MLQTKFFLLIVLLLNLKLHPQTFEPPESLNTPENIISFADYLFCTGDYFRGAHEYEKYLIFVWDDTVYQKAALSYLNSGNFDKAKKMFMQKKRGSPFYIQSLMELYKILLLKDEYNDFIISADSLNKSEGDENLIKLIYGGRLLAGELPDKLAFMNEFSTSNEMKTFYEDKQNPEVRNPLVAGILSAVIPGSGKIYTGQYWDGVFAFISTGLLGYLAYDNFQAGHNFRGWLFGGIASFFYAGNVYGSAISAEVFNRNFRTSIDIAIKNHLEKKNYFIPNYEFCR